MQILTKDGYKNIEDVEIGEELIYYDLYTGQKSTNQLVAKTLLNVNSYTDLEHFELYRINGITISGFDSIWVLENGSWNVNHAQNLMTGSIICDDLDNDLVVNSYEWAGTSSTFWQLSVSGDSSYIGDGITLHNASRYWVGGNGTSWAQTGPTNWSSTSGGPNNASVPVSADAVFFDSNSSAFPCLVLNTLSVSIASINFTGHTGSLTINGTISTPGGAIHTFSGLSTIDGTGTLQTSAPGQAVTINANSQTINCNLFNYTGIAFNGTFSVNGMITYDNPIGNAYTFNRTNVGDTLYANGGFTITKQLLAGNMPIWFQGGTVTTTNHSSTFYGFQGNDLYINGNPTFLTFSCHYGTFSYVSGTPNMTNSFLNNNAISGIKFNLAGIVWNKVLLNGENGGPTLLSDLEANETTINGGNFQLNSGATMSYLKTGSLDFQRAALTGSASIAFVRTGTWSYSAPAGSEMRLPISFEPGCNITLSKNNFVFTGKSMTYNGGTVTTTGATMTIYTTTTLDLKGGFGFDNLAFNNANFFTITNLSEILVTGTLSVQSGVITCNGGTINPRNINMTTDLRGTTDITIKQTGNLRWTAGPSSVIRNNIIFDSPGTSNITGNIRHITGTISYVKGRFTGNSTFTYLGTSQIVTNFSQSLPTSMFGNFN